MNIKRVKSERAPAPIGPYSQAIEVNSMLFLSGQIAIVPDSGEIISGGITEQTEQVLANLRSVLEAGGSNLSHVIKTTIYLKNMDDFAKVNDIYASYFSDSKPARATVEVSRLPKDVLVEIDCIAIKGA